MRRNYLKPQSEVLPLSTEVMQDAMSIVHHSGGGTGFSDPDQMD